MENVKKFDGTVVGEEEANIKRDFMKSSEKVADAATKAKSSFDEAIKNIQAYCRKNPGMAIGIAAGAGALVSLAIVKAFSEKESANEKMISKIFQKAEKVWSEMKNGIPPVVKSVKDSVGV
jgi:ElaB/YqjD/DUF883 family membrane-anchored ribosome-binding protein